MNLATWCQRWWHVLPPDAQDEFNRVMQPHSFSQPDHSEKSESAIQADIRLAASQSYRAPLWRNNNGAAMMQAHENEQPRHVRFGLGNDSAKVNKAWKSSDLIGITPVQISIAHIGKTLGVFTAVEVKTPGWHLTPGDKRAQAQSNFMNSVATFGGFAGFAQSVDDFHRIVQQGRPLL